MTYKSHYLNKGTYPQDYLEWCFGEACTISELTKAKQLELMEEEAREEALWQALKCRSLVSVPVYDANEFEPVPAHQVSTDKITELLEQVA